MRQWCSFLVAGALATLTLCTGRALSQCPDAPPAETLKRSYTGVYANPAYGFAVTIPPGLAGRDVDNPLYQRGFTILFSDPEESLRVYADTNSLDWRSAGIAAKEYSRFFTEKAAKVLSSAAVDTGLDGHQATRITVHYMCGSSQTQYASISTVSLSRDRRFVYVVRWEGKADKLQSGEDILGMLLKSWHFRKPTG
jgi:hypothetical protein